MPVEISFKEEIHQRSDANGPLPPQRRYVLVSREIVRKRRIPIAELGFDKPQSNQHLRDFATSGKHPLRITQRLCQVCHVVRPISDIIMLTDDIEKLLILLFAIYRRKLVILEAVRVYKLPVLYTCQDHFAETSSEILKMFGATSATGLFRSRQRKVAQVLGYANHISGTTTESSKLIHYAHVFMMNYPESSAVVGPMIKSEDIPVENTVECRTIEAEVEITPKCFRQPRKQRLVNDEEGCSSSMLRIIKQDSMHMPVIPDPYSFNRMDNPVQCCFCLQICEKDSTIQVPKTKHRITIWAHELGEEFGERFKMNATSYMCRKHFSQHDFSSRGRLLRGAVPNVIPPPEVHTFKVQGDNFVKVSEDELKTPFERESEIDVVN